ncbi:sulfotransferase family protein [Draconibacterium halophilum]|uniref:Sulfotransferase n=1 Tax=Draconibacterium halophilum TaxID=2706887 RepID=A0A6C0RFA6_9BACT|nr:sulfotransferase [Draconibacterium halophilum]QIA08522.1 sulfotransferase [Draconibacterium halophilum]
MDTTTTFIFIIGAPRSGTTWLHKMISEHPEVSTFNGSNTFLQGYIFPLIEKYKHEKKEFTERGFTRGLPSKITQKQLNSLIIEYIRIFYQFIPENKQYYVEKATDLTSELNSIKYFIPNSKFIHIVRDGRNAVLSEVKIHKKYEIGIDNILLGAKKWVSQILDVREYQSKHNQDIIEIKYEDLFQNTNLYLTRIFDFLGVSNETGLVTKISEKYNYKRNMVSMPTNNRLSFSDGLFNTYKKEMNYFELTLFEYLASDILKDFGYEVDNKRISFISNRLIKYVVIPYFNTKYFLKILAKKIKIKLSNIS